METRDSLCPKFHKAVELIGRRWTGALVQVLLGGPHRFSDLRDAVPEITDRMLSERLKELEAEGIVRRIVTPETPVRIEYGLTQKGAALRESLAAIGAWANDWGGPGTPPRLELAVSPEANERPNG